MIVYRLTSPSGRQYVGQTRLSLRRRLSQHTAHAKEARTPIQRAVLKYGIEAFEAEVLGRCWTQEELDVLERSEIAQLPGDRYNLEVGGGGGPGRKHSAKTRQKMSESHQRYCAALPAGEMARRSRLSSATQKGVPKSEESRMKMRIAARRRRDAGYLPPAAAHSKAYKAAKCL